MNVAAVLRGSSMPEAPVEPEPEPSDGLEEVAGQLEVLRLSSPGTSGLLSSAAALPTASTERTLWILSNPRFGVQGLRVLDREFERRFALRSSTPEDLRFYVVWRVDRATDPTRLTGLHVGVEDRAYSQILIENQRVFTGLRFRRVNSLEAGHTLFLAEAGRQQAPTEHAERVFFWQ